MNIYNEGNLICGIGYMGDRVAGKSTGDDEATQTAGMVTLCPQGLKGQGEEEAELPEPRGQGHLPNARIVAGLSGRNQRPKESHCQKCH